MAASVTEEQKALEDFTFSICVALEKCHGDVGTDLINKLWEKREKWMLTRLVGK